MIAYLRGTLVRKSPGQAIVEAGGVGYGLAIPLSTFVRLGERGETVELLVHTHLTSESLSLFGFAAAEEKDMFLKLIGVSGIGPKLALNVLSGIGAEDLARAIQTTDVARLTQIPGVGKKTALRIAMELQDKLEQREKVLAARESPEKEELVSALLNMGFRRKEVERVVDKVVAAVPAEDGFEKRLRECLKRLAKV